MYAQLFLCKYDIKFSGLQERRKEIDIISGAAVVSKPRHSLYGYDTVSVHNLDQTI